MLHKPKRHGLLAVSPLFVMGLLLLGFGMMWGGASRVPLLVVFVLTAVWAVASLRGFTLGERMRCFSRGAGHASQRCRNSKPHTSSTGIRYSS